MDELLLPLRWLPMIILATLLVITTACLAPDEQSTSGPVVVNAMPTAELPIAPVRGAQAPDFTLTDLNGDEVSLSDLRGQLVLLNFWATW